MRFPIVFFTLAILGYLSVVEAAVIPEGQLQGRLSKSGGVHKSTKSGVGAGCTTSADCEKGLFCFGGKCADGR